MTKKNHLSYLLTSVSLGVLLVSSACSSFPGQSSESGKDIAANGPTIMNARVEPSTVELNRDLQPVKTAEVLADIKDFKSEVRNAKLKFLHVPVQVPMEKVGGTTWRAELSPQNLQMLAVSGKTIKYDAVVVAQDANGQTSESLSPFSVAIKAPDLATNTGTG